jgi:hypothetical protein
MAGLERIITLPYLWRSLWLMRVETLALSSVRDEV